MLEAMLNTLLDALPAAANTAQIAELKRLPELERLPELDYGASGGGSQPRMALAYLVSDPKRPGHHAATCATRGTTRTAKASSASGAVRRASHRASHRSARAAPSPPTPTPAPPLGLHSMTFANRSPPGAAKGSWRDAYPNVRARLNAKSEAEPGYTAYAALAKELLKATWSAPDVLRLAIARPTYRASPASSATSLRPSQGRSACARARA